MRQQELLDSVDASVAALPPWVGATIVTTAVTVAVLIWVGVTRLAARAGVPARTRRRLAVLTAVLPGAWLVAAPLTARALQDDLPGLREGSPNLSTLPLILAPVVLGVLLLRVPTWRRLVEAAPQSWLIGVQFSRNIGAVFLVLMAAGTLPAYFAVPAAYGDLISGLPTLLVAYLIARGWARWRTAVRTINLIGLLDFVVALGIGSGLLHSAALNRALFDDASITTAVFAYPPLSLIPLFVVPIGVVLHIYSLRKLAWDTAAARPVTTARTVSTRRAAPLAAGAEPTPAR